MSLARETMKRHRDELPEETSSESMKRYKEDVSSSAAQRNQEWLKLLCAGSSEIIPPEKCWVIEPTIAGQDIRTQQKIAERRFNSTDVVLFCAVPDNYYQQCLAPKITLWEIKFLGLQSISAKVMAHLIKKLNFNTITKIAIRDLEDKALWFLYYKLFVLEIAGNNNITLIFGDNISAQWQKVFTDIKNETFRFPIMKVNTIGIFEEWIETINHMAEVKANLERHKEFISKGFQNTRNTPLIEEIGLNQREQKLMAALAERDTRIDDLERQVMELKNKKVKAEAERLVSEELLLGEIPDYFGINDFDLSTDSTEPPGLNSVLSSSDEEKSPIKSEKTADLDRASEFSFFPSSHGLFGQPLTEIFSDERWGLGVEQNLDCDMVHRR